MQKTEINWNKIKSSVNSLQESLNEKINLSRGEKHALLKKRAQALAIEKKVETDKKNLIEIVVFRLAAELYGIESKFIREVYPLKDYTVLPGAPTFVLGIMNMRGQIIPVVDLKKFFHLPEKGLGELNKIILLQNETMEFGVLADAVEGTTSVTLEDILSAPPSVNGIGEKYLKGITKDHMILLDAESILNDEKIIVNEEVI